MDSIFRDEESRYPLQRSLFKSHFIPRPSKCIVIIFKVSTSVFYYRHVDNTKRTHHLTMNYKLNLHKSILVRERQRKNMLFYFNLNSIGLHVPMILRK